MPYAEGSGEWIPEPARLSRLAFRWRYTIEEQVAIHRAEMEHSDPNVRATLTVLRLSLSEAEDVDPTDPRTVQGVEFHAALGLIAAARVPEILATP